MTENAESNGVAGLTSAELKDELDRFAEAVFKPYMTQMARSLRRMVREEIRQGGTGVRASTIFPNGNLMQRKEEEGEKNDGKPAEAPAVLCCENMPPVAFTKARNVGEPGRLAGSGDTPLEEWNIQQFEEYQAPYPDIDQPKGRVGTDRQKSMVSSSPASLTASQAAVLAELRDETLSGRISRAATRSSIGQDNEAHGLCKWLACVERNPWFERSVSLAILLNGLWIGFATEYMAQNELKSIPLAFTYVEAVFLGFFALELGIRFLVSGIALFIPSSQGNPTLLWNYFDALVILLQVAEFAVESVLSGLYVIRVLRLVRLVRIIRLVKVLRFVRELRVIVYSIWMSGGLFVWAVVALLLMNFMCSVVFTDFVLDKKVNTDLNDQERADLNLNFGSLYKTMFSLFKAVTGGEDWGKLTDALGSSEILIQLMFTAYIAFTLFAMLNVISGIFLETAMEAVRDEREMYVMRNARLLFKTIDQTGNGNISLEDFERALDHPHMRGFLEAIDVGFADANNLFDLLDSSGDQMVSSDEFLSGCLRLRGPSKSLDLLVLSKELHQLIERYQA
mmetsp:Transcript_55508/g.107049  ORF Transcript_55508/g.107049 Transcript_55508/m.107049 type:complete len:565 (+) Transcript_55508:97-1791(+)